jgi:hypothetical protein
MASAGPVALQDHGSAVRFRNLWIKPLRAAETSKPVPGSGFVPLFNAKDLTGWKTHPSQPGNWRVENGVLIGSGGFVSHLYTERADYQDFHLRMEARVNANGNTGVYFRAPFGPSVPQNAKTRVGPPTWVRGYNAKLDQARTGGLLIDDLFLVRAREVPALHDQWVMFEVIAEESHLTVKLNGEITAEFTDAARRYTSGHIVLQKHGGATVAQFRKIEIKELPPPDGAGENETLSKARSHARKHGDIQRKKGKAGPSR